MNDTKCLSDSIADIVVRYNFKQVRKIILTILFIIDFFVFDKGIHHIISWDENEWIINSRCFPTYKIYFLGNCDFATCPIFLKKLFKSIL